MIIAAPARACGSLLRYGVNGDMNVARQVH